MSGSAPRESRSAVSSRQHDWQRRIVTGRAVLSTKKLAADSSTCPYVNTESKCWPRTHSRALRLQRIKNKYAAKVAEEVKTVKFL